MKSFLILIFYLSLKSLFCEEFKIIQDLFDIVEVRQAYVKALPYIKELHTILTPSDYNYFLENFTNVKVDYSEFTTESFDFYYGYNDFLHIKLLKETLKITGAVKYQILDVPMQSNFTAYMKNFGTDQLFYVKFMKDASGKYYYDYSIDITEDKYTFEIEDGPLKVALTKVREKKIWNYPAGSLFRGHLIKVYDKIFDQLLEKLNNDLY